jgi:hypothetical protein
VSESDKFEDFFDLYADNDPRAVEAKADLMEHANASQSPDHQVSKVGMFHLADDLSKSTGKPRVLWLQRIASAISGMPGQDEKFFEINYFDLRKMEAQGLEAVKQLARKESFYEPNNMERLLSSIWLPADQVYRFVTSALDIRFNEKISVDANVIRQLLEMSSTGDPRYTPSKVRQAARKLDTQAMYDDWKQAYRKLKNDKPGRTDSWYAQQIAKMDIAQDRNAETIRKRMKQ